ncbi:MAG: alpha-amylase family glycosyl hydrolase, partial [Spirochaetota bacterium]
LDYCVRGTMDAEDFDIELKRLRNAHSDSIQSQLNLLGSHDTRRIMTVCNEDISKLMLSLVFQFTYLGAPMIYYGDEIGMTGEDDPLCRGTMIWEKEKWNTAVHKMYRTLIEIRKKNAALRRGCYKTLKVFNHVFSYFRSYKNNSIIIIINSGQKSCEVAIKLPEEARPTEPWIDLLSLKRIYGNAAKIKIKELKARSAMILAPLTPATLAHPSP